ncbi:hypothetical protein GWK47_024492 [Chionoecetes opilio]|uniref:Uncharacterized protein n=1 Tax=Chionoecetes opilio TaxID=41210 RepID=A0A8J5CFR3_CHIOP|nr:hypothetical protein GWK47_024492 [Chionoecetes opilio]
MSQLILPNSPCDDIVGQKHSFPSWLPLFHKPVSTIRMVQRLNQVFRSRMRILLPEHWYGYLIRMLANGVSGTGLNPSRVDMTKKGTLPRLGFKPVQKPHLQPSYEGSIPVHQENAFDSAPET